MPGWGQHQPLSMTMENGVEGGTGWARFFVPIRRCPEQILGLVPSDVHGGGRKGWGGGKQCIIPPRPLVCPLGWPVHWAGTLKYNNAGMQCHWLMLPYLGKTLWKSLSKTKTGPGKWQRGCREAALTFPQSTGLLKIPQSLAAQRNFWLLCTSCFWEAT